MKAYVLQCYICYTASFCNKYLETRPEILQLPPQSLCFSLCQFIQNFPKLRSVVHFFGVGELMQEYIIHQVRWK